MIFINQIIKELYFWYNQLKMKKDYSKNKKCVYLTDRSLEFISLICGRKTRNSEIINASIEHFRIILSTNLPVLTEQEWKRLLDLYRGTLQPTQFWPPRIVSDYLDDRGIELDAPIAPEHAHFIDRINELNDLEQLAILYVIEIFWSRHWQNKSLEGILKEIHKRMK